MERDSLLTGLVLGAILPVLGYVFFEQLFLLLEQTQTISTANGYALIRRMRTISLLAICTNLLAFNWGKANRYDNTMRGVIFPTLIYVGFWVYKYYDQLYN